MRRLQDKIVLVVGAAGAIGRTVAAAVKRERGIAVAADLAPGTDIDHVLDVTAEESWRGVVAEVAHAHGRLDGLVNAAGIALLGSIEDTDYASWRRVQAVNLDGTFLGCKYAFPLLKRGGGSIVNLSSISGIVGQGYIHVGYNASKGAVRLITKAAAAQHGRDRIRVNSVHPGLMPPMRTSGRTADPETRAKTLKGVPMGRAGEVDEVAYAILFLASDESSYVTGAEIVVDGGWTAV